MSCIERCAPFAYLESKTSSEFGAVVSRQSSVRLFGPSVKCGELSREMCAAEACKESPELWGQPACMHLRVALFLFVQLVSSCNLHQFVICMTEVVELSRPAAWVSLGTPEPGICGPGQQCTCYLRAGHSNSRWLAFPSTCPGSLSAPAMSR